MTQRSKPIAALFFCGVSAIVILAAFVPRADSPAPKKAIECAQPEKACVFLTLTGLAPFDTSTVTVNNKLVEAALRNGLNWVLQAQQPNGGWGAGSHQHQDVRDPQAVQADPATTALVGMALLRTSDKPFVGNNAEKLRKAVAYLLKAVENTPEQSVNITTLTNTQPQTKLGKNIDVILTAQFFSNALRYLNNSTDMKAEVEKALQKCVANIQKAQDKDGGWKDGGWAPVLQSALANNALEGAKDAGAKVDDKVIERSRDYQKQNYDVKTNSAVTGKAAGVLLYSVSSSARASAKEAGEAKQAIDQAKKAGKLDKNAAVDEANLEVIGYSKTEAQKYATAYKIKNAAAQRAQDKDVETGFGNNGGEEFLSYLMTGESLIIGGNEWKSWYEKMSGRLVQIQNGDGSWNGHHCITSPVFCTATCLLILSVDKDIDFLIKTK
ncbi:prenyltransferase/squalene oxidase repeat-containing protein [Paraflavitalea sp. CAU 1676]|uniref:prenyltransferase/squalene oxidase repeat-containing protein n=1 Tax=Paraflavitalea sp. CAU 1676 TaxID=3032598 RepID=UPI0023DBA198|nr:prenyltransferase/squalene oxidase repeat-containing protein [Paraflavitalea sp. CAU 1676]MDF2191812.1 terpene cyclase/mutase family protein [Paraflavitalea sp. CAU 1676]